MEGLHLTGQSKTRRIRVVRKSWPQNLHESEFRNGIVMKCKLTSSAIVTSLESKLKAIEMSAQEFEEVQNSFVLNWEALPEQKQSKTIFNSNLDFLENPNEEELARIVSLFSNVRPSKGKSSTSRDTVLEQHRATVISVAIKRMKLVPNKFAKFSWALRDMNEAYLSTEAVEIIRSASLWPSKKEIEELKHRVRAGLDLAEPDALLWFIATSIPDMAARIHALAFRYDFDQLFGEMIKGTSLIKAASMELCESQLLKRVLRVILLIGNNINQTYGGTAAAGIQVKSLTKLESIKTRDESLSVLDCIVLYLSNMAPETFGVSDECTCTMKVAKLSLQVQTQLLKDTRRGLLACGKITAMTKFVANASTRLETVDRELKQAKSAYDKCLDHFCIERGTMDTDEFFSILSQFFEQFDKAVLSLKERQKKVSRAIPKGPSIKRIPQVALQSGVQNPQDKRKENSRISLRLTSRISMRKSAKNPQLTEAMPLQIPEEEVSIFQKVTEEQFENKLNSIRQSLSLFRKSRALKQQSS